MKKDIILPKTTENIEEVAEAVEEGFADATFTSLSMILVSEVFWGATDTISDLICCQDAVSSYISGAFKDLHRS